VRDGSDGRRGSIDLGEQTYPVQQPVPKNIGQPMDPMMAMATVGFIYIDDEGTEWAGPGSIYVGSFRPDGTIEDTFSDVSLPHTDKTLPNVTVTDGSLKVRISDPW
jgi:hypothetical protein